MKDELTTDLADFLRRILNTRSTTAIVYTLEDRLAETGLAEAERIRLSRILEARSLDAMYAECHEALGEHDKARVLREWDAGREARQLARRARSL